MTGVDRDDWRALAKAKGAMVANSLLPTLAPGAAPSDPRKRAVGDELELLLQPAARPVPATSSPTAVPWGRFGRAPSTTSPALADIGTGIMEAPVQAFAGVSDAIGNTLIAADDLAGWLNTHVADLRFSTLFGMNGEDTPDKTSPVFRQFAEGFKALPQPKSVTGSLVRGTAAWIAGLSVSARGLRAVGAGARIANIAGGGISSFFTQAADDPGLANLIQEHPELANPVTDFLASKPGDNAALNRLKHGLEGLGLGALAEGFARGLVLVRTARAARNGEGAATSSLATDTRADGVEPSAGGAEATTDPSLMQPANAEAPPDQWAPDSELRPADGGLDTDSPFCWIHKERYKTNAELRAEWAAVPKNGLWPKIKGKLYEVSHEIPLADGGPDDISNVKPRTHEDHVNLHRERGDFRRWARRRWYGQNWRPGDKD